MFQIDNSTAAPSMPQPSGPGTPGFFTDGNPAGGIAPTVVTAEFLNALMMEPVNVIMASGQTPSKTDNAQLLKAIQRLSQMGSGIFSNAGGTPDALTGSYTPAITALPAAGSGVLTLYLRATAANATTTPTFTPAPGVIPAKTIVKGAGQALSAGDIAGAGHWIELQYDATFDKWVLLNPATGISVAQRAQIQAVSASVAANAMTVVLNPTNLDFRSSALTSGAVNTRSVPSALSLTIPSGATLGTTSGVASRILLLAIDNAGTVELAVYNAAGAANLDETGVISTTAISGAANSLTVYSQTARTNVPYRIVGYVDSTQATAGTWASSPTAVQGGGGQALAAMSSLGYGQYWQDVTGSRAISTTYYNTTGRPIQVVYEAQGNTNSSFLLSITVNGVLAVRSDPFTTASGQYCSISAIVPPGASYSFAATNAVLSKVTELR